MTQNESGYLVRHIGFGDPHDYNDILSRDLLLIENMAKVFSSR